MGVGFPLAGDENVLQLHTSAQIVNVLNASEFFTVKWLIPCYVHFTSTKKKEDYTLAPDFHMTAFFSYKSHLKCYLF